MPKNGMAGLTCPLCLGVDDPDGMLSVVIERQVPKVSAQISICLRCVDAIAKGMADFAGREDELNASNVEPAASDILDSNNAGDRPGVTLDPAFASEANEADTGGATAVPENSDGLAEEPK
jgi:hypothetical protein